MPSILFVCTANRFRSPIAAGLFVQCILRNGNKQDWLVGSAGTWAEPGLTVVPSAKWVMDHFGLNLEGHKARRIERGMLANHDLILVMETSHQEALRVEFPELKNRIHLLAYASTGLTYDIPDPGITSGDTFLDIAKELSELINNGFQRICKLALQLSE